LGAARSQQVTRPVSATERHDSNGAPTLSRRGDPLNHGPCQSSGTAL